MNFENKTFNCKRGKCDGAAGGHFTQLCKMFHETADRDDDRNGYIPKTYKRPEAKVETAKDRVEKYLRLRGFSKETWERYCVGEVNGNIAFPYFENKELVLMKFRKPEKYDGNGQKAWREDGGKSILWGIDLCDVKKPLVITEGEYDCLALAECGVENVVSVPSGSKDLSWIDNCWDWIEKFSKIIFWGDNDTPGKEMVKNCTLRLGQDRCYVVESKYKDANESLFKVGKELTAVEVELAKPIPIYGLLDLADVTPVDVTNLPVVKSGFPALDKDLYGFLMSELSLWTGKSGQGKSTILSQIVQHAIDTGERVCVYSGELSDSRFQYWAGLQAAGRVNLDTYKIGGDGREVGVVPKPVFQKIKDWWRGRFWLYDNRVADNNEETSILKVFQYAARRYGCKVFLIDNLMTSNFNARSDSDFYRAQSEFVGELVHFAKAYQVHVHLVAHPKKTKGPLEKEDVSGTGDITNRADNVFDVERIDKEGIPYDTVLTVLKNRTFGVQNEKYGLRFDQISKRFWGHSDPRGESFKFGWDTDVPAPSIFDEMGDCSESH